MARFDSPLDRVRIAAPCSADWDQMIGTDRVRFCAQCSLNVYNLSSMTRNDAESFIARNEGRLCVRFYRRADGSILTRNCPVGLRAIHRRLSHLARATATLVLSFFTGLGVYETVAKEDPTPQRTMGVIALPTVDQPPAEAWTPAVTGELVPPEMDYKKSDVALGRPVLRRKKGSQSHQ